ncbi:hypothetical protein [Sphingomonas sp. CFBP 13720]|uniref:hypothetical protein n=1 Tax=Sphingomonas sp. CFBP 13720 TaxID=2775302 RepID=UPI00177ED680|nr:hypothetical protein [Sphingomonas sp. CFBP 13720]MBD8679423.1 hypothetical protein [Sphingomonas sp. CFBP 13720]
MTRRIIRLCSATGKATEDMLRAMVIILSLFIIPNLSAAGRSSETLKAIASTSCDMPLGWGDIALRKPRFGVFGEVHGTQEAPELFGRVACALAAQGKSVLVAVEHDVSFDPAYQAAWRQPPEKFAAALLQAGWKGSRDGKGSVAMLDMLKRLHQLAWQGRAIRLTAFDGERDDVQHRKFGTLPGQRPREAAQADNIRIAADQASYDFILVLTGNFHASKQSFKRGGTAVEPMAMHLARIGPMVTLDARYSRGSAWTCELKPGMRSEPGKPISKDAIECAIHSVGMQPDLGQNQFLSLNASSDADDAYDGFFWLGTIHGSPPAVRDQ